MRPGHCAATSTCSYVFVDGERVADRAGLGDPLRPDCVVHILQALSGG
jgi:hypothetical protein